METNLRGAPSISEQAWDTEFEKYKLIPEYRLQNSGMSLSEFKVIYWWSGGIVSLEELLG